jgi:hypothetical protein
MRTLCVALTCAVALALGGRTSATVVTYNFGLDGLQEVPPVNTTGWGVATVTLDTVSGLLTWDVAYFDLLSPSTAAHFHGAALPGQNAGVQVDMGPGETFGVTSGTLNGSATINAAQIQDVLDGLWYINIHSQLHPGGEIRGQVVPAPGALALLGLGALGAVRRRRRS